MAYLQFLQVARPVIEYRDIPQAVLDVGQHQASPIHIEDRVSGLNDLAHRIHDAHLAEAQRAELVQSLVHIVQGERHLVGPHMGTGTSHRARLQGSGRTPTAIY
jgi:hypothetical protein